MVLTTLTLAAGLLAAPEPQAEPPKGWVVEIRGYTYHTRAKPEGWIVEVRGFIEHRKQPEPPKVWIIDWQFHQTKPRIEPVEGQYHDDLSAFFDRLKVQVQVDAVEAFYVDDLSAFFNRLRRQKP